MREDDLVRLIARHAGAVPEGDVGIGDDAAVVSGRWILAHDMLVEDVHFRWAWATPADVGHKALAVNVSDVAAMGAEPRAVVVGLALGPGPLSGDGAVASLYDAMTALAGRHGCAIVGGDTSSSATTVVGVTVLGACPTDVAPVRRDTARPGDALYVTRTLGAAAAGLAVLEGHAAASHDPDGALRAAQRRPEPQTAHGVALARAGARAMIDCSDGLARDVGRLAAASGLAAVVDLDAVPTAPGVADVARAVGADPGVFAATGGEDYALIAAFAPGATLPADVPLTCIGRLEPGSGVRFTPDGRVPSGAALGWQHDLP